MKRSRRSLMSEGGADRGGHVGVGSALETIQSWVLLLLCAHLVV